jgi:hypothetical protein
MVWQARKKEKPVRKMVVPNLVSIDGSFADPNGNAHLILQDSNLDETTHEIMSILEPTNSLISLTRNDLHVYSLYPISTTGRFYRLSILL